MVYIVICKQQSNAGGGSRVSHVCCNNLILKDEEERGRKRHELATRKTNAETPPVTPNNLVVFAHIP